MRIHQAILSGKYPNCTKLAQELEVSTKSVARDLEFMRDRLNFPLEYDKTRWGYYYTEEVALGIAAEIAPSLFDSNGAPIAKRLGPAILAARANGVRWSRIAVYLGLPEKEVREAATKEETMRARGTVRPLA